MTRINTTFERLLGRNDLKRFRSFRLGADTSMGEGASSAVPASGEEASPVAPVSGSPGSDPKQSAQTPLALTGAVHLLYRLPHVLQIAMMRGPNAIKVSNPPWVGRVPEAEAAFCCAG